MSEHHRGWALWNQTVGGRGWVRAGVGWVGDEREGRGGWMGLSLGSCKNIYGLSDLLLKMLRLYFRTYIIQFKNC